MNKRTYPLFLIDRSKAAAYPFDYITCFDQTCGFVARVVPFFSDQPFNEFITMSRKIEGSEYASVTYKFNRGGVVLVIEDYLYDFQLTGEVKTRIHTLLKKALKKYLHAEVERTPANDLSIENQIKQQELTIERARQNYDDLVHRANGDREYADYQIALAEATLETLKKFRDNQKYFILNLN